MWRFRIHRGKRRDEKILSLKQLLEEEIELRTRQTRELERRVDHNLETEERRVRNLRKQVGLNSDDLLPKLQLPSGQQSGHTILKSNKERLETAVKELEERIKLIKAIAN